MYNPIVTNSRSLTLFAFINPPKMSGSGKGRSRINRVGQSPQIDNLISGLVGGIGEEVVAAATSSGHQIAEKVGDIAVKAATQTAAKLADKAGSKIISVMTGGGSGQTNQPRPDGSYSSNNKGIALDYNANPVRIELSTGIKPNTYSPLYHRAVTNFCAPLHLTLAELRIPLNSGLLDQYFSGPLTFAFKNAVQGSVSFSINTSLLSPANVRNAFNALLTALQVYFFTDAILMYSNNPQNRNEGMLALRENISAEALNELLILRRILLGTPIPPNMLNLAFYMCQVYTSGDNVPGSPLIMMCPMRFVNGGSVPDYVTEINDATNSLRNFDDTFALLSRACPNWVNPVLPAGSIVPFFDTNFCTIWNNLPFQMTGTGYSHIGPTVSDGAIKYTACANDLDGAAYALTAIYQSVGPVWLPSLIVPFTHTFGTDTTNRISFARNGAGIPGFYNIAGSASTTYSRHETYIIDSGSKLLVTSHKNGTERCEAVTPDTVTQTAYQLLEWMMSLSSILKRKDTRYEGGDNSGGNRKRRRK